MSKWTPIIHTNMTIAILAPSGYQTGSMYQHIWYADYVREAQCDRKPLT